MVGIGRARFAPRSREGTQVKDLGGPAAWVAPAGSRSDKRLRRAPSIHSSPRIPDSVHREGRSTSQSAWRGFLSLRDPTALTGRSGHPVTTWDHEPNDDRRRGFTLFEVLLVMAVMVMILGLGWPVVERYHSEYRLRQGGLLIQS